MSFNAIYRIAGSSMNAQTVRLNTVASNLANADSAAGIKPVSRSLRRFTKTIC